MSDVYLSVMAERAGLSHAAARLRFDPACLCLKVTAHALSIRLTARETRARISALHDIGGECTIEVVM